jgi:CMP/dCMP kinase
VSAHRPPREAPDSVSSNQDQPFVVALDGPAAAGKSSVGRGVAERLGFRYFDTGLLYRALTWLALELGVQPNDANRLTAIVDQFNNNLEIDSTGRVLREGVDITDELQQPRVDAAVSEVSAHPGVRLAMRPTQRAPTRPPGLVMAGRDIGTVIVPEAPLKIWLNASAEERARRRSTQTGEPYMQVLDGMRRRDQLDASRENAPMARAADAITVETDGLELDAVIAKIVSHATHRGARRPRRTR